MLKELGQLSLAISAVRILDDAMPMQQLAVFLEVAKNENGISVSDLATKTGIASSSASRNWQALSDWHWLKRPGLGLVVAELDPMDIRQKIIKLKPKGKQLANQLVAALQKKEVTT